MSFNIIVKNYQHYNRALGKYISTKKQYNEELRQQGFVSFEEGCKLAEKKSKESKWIPSKNCTDMMREVLDKKDKNIVLGQHPRLVDGMRKMGVKFELPDWLSKHYQEGGFNATEERK